MEDTLPAGPFAAAVAAAEHPEDAPPLEVWVGTPPDWDTGPFRVVLDASGGEHRIHVEELATAAMGESAWRKLPRGAYDHDERDSVLACAFAHLVKVAKLLPPPLVFVIGSALLSAGCSSFPGGSVHVEGYGLAADVTLERAQALCEPGEDWATCLPKCAAQERGAADPPVAP